MYLDMLLVKIRMYTTSLASPGFAAFSGCDCDERFSALAEKLVAICKDGIQYSTVRPPLWTRLSKAPPLLTPRYEANSTQPSLGSYHRGAVLRKGYPNARIEHD